MKKLQYITRLACSAAIATAALTSCQDWLTIYPQNKIVEENFWEDKNDLEGVRYAAYKSMAGNLEKIVLWGDLRSDSYILSPNDESTATRNFYDELRSGNIERDSDNTYFDWTGFYTTINYCNKILHYGAAVLERDKQFTRSEWTQMRAEMTALRALNYFYLIRSFKDVPYTTKVINKDSEVEYFSATNQLQVLDSLIVDVESVKSQATNRFTSLNDTKGLMTKPAIYALLSDMYLWRASLHEGRGIKQDTVYLENTTDKGTVKNLIVRNDSAFVVHTIQGDYENCVAYADTALAKLAEQTRLNNQNSFSSRDEKNSYGLTNCEMYKNDFDDFKQGGQARFPAYENVFTQGNSEESIFEIQYNSRDSRSNDVVTSQWGYGNRVHLAVSESALDAIYGSTKKAYDSRMWLYAWKSVTSLGGTSYTTDFDKPYCFKWRNARARTPENGKVEEVKISTNSTNDNYRNWIVYRMSDVMLQKAEALAALSKTENDARAEEARRIVNALHRRWHCPDVNMQHVPGESVMDKNGAAYFASNIAATVGNIPSPTTPSGTSIIKTEIAVLNERQIEFLAEGKRWFDLVRFAERHAGGMNDGTKDPREWTEANPVGDGKKGVDLMVDHFMLNTLGSNIASSLKNRLKNRYGLYNLIYYMEIKASKDKDGVQHLEQNPVWNKALYD